MSQSEDSSPEPVVNDSTTTQHRSTNCAKGQAPTSLFTFFATNQDDSSHEFNGFMLSCQTHDFDVPDSMTLQSIKNVSSTVLSRKHEQNVEQDRINVSAHGIRLGLHGINKSAEEISRRRMASNCGPDYRLHNVTAYNRFSCRYLGKGIDDRGREVTNPFKTWKGTLPSCDSGFSIDDSVESDIRKLAWHAAGGEEAKLDANQFLCDIQSIPLQ